MITKKDVSACKKMSKTWKSEEKSKEYWHTAPTCSVKWIKKEKGEPWHKSLQGKNMDWNKWMKEELHEEGVETWHSEHKPKKGGK